MSDFVFGDESKFDFFALSFAAGLSENNFPKQSKLAKTYAFYELCRLKPICWKIYRERRFSIDDS